MKTTLSIGLALVAIVLTATGAIRKTAWPVGYPVDTRNFTIRAVSGSLTDVSNALTQLQPGGVMHVPGGAAAWATNYTFPQAVEMRGTNWTLKVISGTAQWDGTNMVPGSGAAVAVSTNSVTVGWSLLTADARVTGARLRYWTGSGAVTTITTTTNSFVLTNLASGTYLIYGTARDVWGNDGAASDTNTFIVQ